MEIFSSEYINDVLNVIKVRHFIKGQVTLTGRHKLSISSFGPASHSLAIFIDGHTLTYTHTNSHGDITYK
uniref:Uncharacterized protein n=1 Tax=Octopus bimaculoides TaxID=37653 RepID=A0A0L8I144_OCTBM